VTDKLYEIGLNEVIALAGPDDIQIRRVPGGWIYTTYVENGTGGCNVSSCFVPFNNEFQS